MLQEKHYLIQSCKCTVKGFQIKFQFSPAEDNSSPFNSPLSQEATAGRSALLQRKLAWACPGWHRGIWGMSWTFEARGISCNLRKHKLTENADPMIWESVGAAWKFGCLRRARNNIFRSFGHQVFPTTFLLGVSLDSARCVPQSPRQPASFHMLEFHSGI